MASENWEATYFMRAYETRETTEDGEPIIGESFDIFVENERGERFFHEAVFNSPNRSTFEATRAKAERFIAKINAAIAAGTWAGPRNNPHWAAGRPAYGSAAYAANWREYEAEDIRLEKSLEGIYD